MADEKNTSILLPIDIEAEMKKSYLDYAMSVIIARALPDVRDGLKPVQRRILVAMNDLGLASNRGYRKCAKICGDTSGNYHPHGEAVIYPALVRLAQDFNMRAPLIDGQGNFGSVDGDPPAAMRYTEARLAKITEDILADLEKETVDFIPNFDQTREEPVVLPSRIPNLLVNGASGIAVGMATNIPPHNLREIVDAAILLLDKPDASLAEVMKIVQGPDFPTGAYIAGREGILSAYRTGRGSFMMRAKAAIEEAGKDRENIIITEIPYQVNKSRLIERIAELVQNKKIEGISDVRDESSREGMRIVVELKRGEESQLILNNLFKQTQMQESFGMILLAIVGGQPRELGLIPLIKLFLEHRIDVVRRRTIFDLRKAEQREHILVGYQIALDHLDNVIRIIRGSSSRADAKDNLFKYFTEQDVTISENGKSRKIEGVKLDGRKYRFQGAPELAALGRDNTLGLSYAQIDAILELQLHRLTQLSQGIEVHPGTNRRVAGNPQQREETQTSDHRGTARSPQGLRRRSPHANRGQGRRDQARRPDRRHGDADHRESRGLYQAHRCGHLPPPIARRQRAHRRQNQGRRFRRVPIHRLSAQLHSAVYLQGPRLLAESLRIAGSGRRHARQGHHQPGEIPGRRKAHGARRRARPGSRGHLRVPGHQERHREKMRACGIFQSALQRHHRHQLGWHGRAGRRHADRRQENDLPCQP
jgi:hypothetical protein